jgi:phosphoribosylformimino-5-aminoimidazole carboxamide ribotide isomerase
MNIIPSIDLQDGQCVRLKKGKFDQVTYYGDDPIQVAQRYQAQGARYLHVVDLDGAKQGKLSQLNAICRLKNATQLFIQVGGGIKERSTIETLLSLGIHRLVLGSIAVNDPSYTKALIDEFGVDTWVLALDVEVQPDAVPLVMTHGWQQKSSIHLWDLLNDYAQVGIKHVLCTDIDKDGMLQGPNVNLYQQCQKRYPHIHFQASGGVSSLEDLQTLKESGIASVIVGKALLDGQFTLEEAIKEVV